LLIWLGAWRRKRLVTWLGILGWMIAVAQGAGAFVVESLLAALFFLLLRHAPEDALTA
jgi:hypothetical protein